LYIIFACDKIKLRTRWLYLYFCI